MIRLGVVATAAVGVLAWGVAAEAGSARNFVAHLTGDGEVPARATQAQGQAKVQFDRAGETLVCKLNAANIENVVQAHIHLGSATENGPVVAFLYGPVPAGGGRTDGRLSKVEITDADLRGPLAGKTVADLRAAIRAGNAYVNVHTSDGVAPPNTGPGDFPGGEIRGQLR